MTNRYKTLQAKIHELESIRNEPHTESHDSCDINQKIDFIRKLISAEVNSHPSKPHHLHHLSQRIDALEKQLHEKNAFRTFSYEEEIDKDSTCSCTESCLNDDGDALDETDLIVFDDPDKLFPDFDKAMVEFKDGVVEDEKIKVGITEKLASFDYEDAEEFFEDFVGDKEIVEYKGGLLKKTEEEKKDCELERRDSAFGKKSCALACGVVIGMILMGFIMVNFSDCFHYVEQESFAFPT